MLLDFQSHRCNNNDRRSQAGYACIQEEATRRVLTILYGIVSPLPSRTPYVCGVHDWNSTPAATSNFEDELDAEVRIGHIIEDPLLMGCSNFRSSYTTFSSQRRKSPPGLTASLKTNSRQEELSRKAEYPATPSNARILSISNMFEDRDDDES